MTEELTTTERNALKWVLFRNYYQELSNEYIYAQERWYKLGDFLKALGVNDDRPE